MDKGSKISPTDEGCVACVKQVDIFGNKMGIQNNYNCSINTILSHITPNNTFFAGTCFTCKLCD